MTDVQNLTVEQLRVVVATFAPSFDVATPMAQSALDALCARFEVVSLPVAQGWLAGVGQTATELRSIQTGHTREEAVLRSLAIEHQPSSIEAEVEAGAQQLDLSVVPGEVLGQGYADWPEWCTTFNERKAYQQGVAHARAIAKGPQHVNGFTVISVDQESGQVFADFVQSKSGLQAFYVVATENRPDQAIDFVCAVDGHRDEGAGIEYPGSTVVGAYTVREQPEVFAADAADATAGVQAMLQVEGFNVRIVRKGDSYGRKDCLVHDGDEPLVEFYDSRYDFAETMGRGQFVSRYNARTLLQNDFAQGLRLEGGVPEWSVSVKGMRTVVQYIEEQLGSECVAQLKCRQPSNESSDFAL